VNEHLAGRFQHDEVVIYFDSTGGGGKKRFELRDARKALVYLGTQNGRTFTCSFYGGRLETVGTLPHDPVEPTPKAGTGERTESSKGDPQALDRFRDSAEYKILPYLSRAIGVNGFSSRTNAASQYVHGIAMASGDVHKTAPPHGAAFEQDPAKCDLRKDPCHNKCFAMCGPECTCWEWVCGDCCGHRGCAFHDETCRLCSCGIGILQNCVACYTGGSYWGTSDPCHAVSECIDPPC
jgi:hypothetical protein